MIPANSVPKIRQSGERPRRVVVACTDCTTQDVLFNLLRQSGFEPIPSSSLQETKRWLAQDETALVMCQERFRDGDFRDLLRVAVREGSKVPVVVCSNFYDPPLYLEAMELGAFDYLASPYDRDGVEWVVGNALKETSPAHSRFGAASA